MADDVETQDVSVRLPVEFIEDELMPMFPAATKTSDAIRMAIQNDLERRKEALSSGSVKNDVVKAIEEHGGSFESIQRLEIDSVENMEVSEAESVAVNNNNSE